MEWIVFMIRVAICLAAFWVSFVTASYMAAKRMSFLKQAVVCILLAVFFSSAMTFVGRLEQRPDTAVQLEE